MSNLGDSCWNRCHFQLRMIMNVYRKVRFGRLGGWQEGGTLSFSASQQRVTCSIPKFDGKVGINVVIYGPLDAFHQYNSYRAMVSFASRDEGQDVRVNVMLYPISMKTSMLMLGWHDSFRFQGWDLNTLFDLHHKIIVEIHLPGIIERCLL